MDNKQNIENKVIYVPGMTLSPLDVNDVVLFEELPEKPTQLDLFSSQSGR
jgi:hypothetical protein